MEIRRDFLDIPLITDGAGDKYLSDDGTYKKIQQGGGGGPTGDVPNMIEWDLTRYVNGVDNTFWIDQSINESTHLTLHYAGLKLSRNDWEVDFVKKEIILSFVPNTNNGRELILESAPHAPIQRRNKIFRCCKPVLP